MTQQEIIKITKANEKYMKQIWKYVEIKIKRQNKKSDQKLTSILDKTTTTNTTNSR